jgi:rsbT co-antagonist protein RsbR
MSVEQWISAASLRDGFESLGVGVAVHEPDGRLQYVNAAGLALLGWTDVPTLSRAELLGGMLPQNAAGDALAPEELPLAHLIAGRDEADGEIAVRLPTGLRRTLRVVGRAIRGPDGARCALVQTFLDNGEAASARGAVRDLVEQSTPVLNVGERILLQPLIGSLDSRRAALAMEKLLEAIGTSGARLAIVDITGVSAVDTATANHLLRSLTAARLLGCEVVLSGVSPPIARTITVLGLDLSALRTKRDVAAAIAFGRRRIEAAEASAPRDSADPVAPGANDMGLSTTEKPARAAGE